jgi:hypothetical protein
VPQAQLDNVPWDALALQEYSPDYPHAYLTLGFTGVPGSPDFYVNMQDNSFDHAHGDDGPEVVFGRLIDGTGGDSGGGGGGGGGGVSAEMGLHLIQTAMQGAHEANDFVCPPSSRVTISGMRVLSEYVRA